MQRTSRVSLVLVAIYVFVGAPAASALPYCALRDPVNSIYELFPDATGYESDVRTVSRDARDAVSQALPFSLHFNELGRHTLYIAKEHGDDLGYVHARTESSRWGLAEFAWAITPDLRIRGVKLQRSRDLALKSAVAVNSSKVLGASVNDLLPLHQQAVATGDNHLSVMLASAMKTLVITRHVWKDRLASAVRPMIGGLPDADSAVPIETLYEPELLQTLSDHKLDQAAIFDRAHVQGYRVFDAAGNPVGIMVNSPIQLEQQNRSIWWSVANDGGIKRVYDAQTRTTPAELADLANLSPTRIEDCSTAAELAAFEVSVVARYHALR